MSTDTNDYDINSKRIQHPTLISVATIFSFGLTWLRGLGPGIKQKKAKLEFQYIGIGLLMLLDRRGVLFMFLFMSVDAFSIHLSLQHKIKTRRKIFSAAGKIISVSFHQLYLNESIYKPVI